MDTVEKYMIWGFVIAAILCLTIPMAIIRYNKQTWIDEEVADTKRKVERCLSINGVAKVDESFKFTGCDVWPRTSK